jgi:2',3'-cyclic-nucleotide 2'-phosphodiesterase (5'-nucleotidase family)
LREGVEVVRQLTIVAVVLIVTLFGLLINDHFRQPSKHLVIFYTSNLRGQVKPFPGTVLDRQYDKAGGLAFIRGFIQATIETYNIKPESTLLLDTGDALFGSPEASLSMGEVPYTLMVKAGYDAMAVGNMEFEFGIETLRAFAQKGQLPLLACNFRDVRAPLGPTFLPGKLLQKGDVKVGIIGLGHGNLGRNTRAENILDVEISDMRSAVAKAASSLKFQGAHIIVMLSHHPELDTIDNLAETFPDVDIIIGDMIGPPPMPQRRPLLCQTAPARGGGVGMIKIAYAGSGWNIEQAFQRLFPIDATRVEPDPLLVGEISRVEAKIDALLEEPIALATGEFPRAYGEESPVGNLIADSMATTAGTDVALLNSGGIKINLASGVIRLRTLYDLLPFENAIVKVILPGWQLENLLEESLSGKGSFLQAAGIRAIYSSSNPPGFRLIQIDVNDEPLEFDRLYSVAVTDFMANNHLGWPELSTATGPTIVGLLRESFKSFLRTKKSVGPELARRFNDFQESDETLRIQALGFELITLAEPVAHEMNLESRYGRLLADVLRVETDADFALVPASMIRILQEPLKVVTPARVLSDFMHYDGVRTMALEGEIVQRMIEASLATGGTPLCFSGFSIELKDGRLARIYPWQGDFDKGKTYRVTLPDRFITSVDGFFDIGGRKFQRAFSDIRRTFINGLRRREGKVDLRRALL